LTAAFVTGGSGFIGGALIRRLLAEGWDVHALVRSEASAQKVTALGAKAIAGDLADVPSMAVGAQYCEVAFHCAAHLGDWGTREEFERGNVQGTRNALAAARQAGLRRFVHVGTETAGRRAAGRGRRARAAALRLARAVLVDEGACGGGGDRGQPQRP
jgi:nucleoside-diphosphate-sugar epimerase